MDPSSRRGLKRKRNPEEDPATHVDGKLFHTLKDIRQATKKAKTFDTQKLVKKLKNLRQKNASDPAIPSLEAQLAILKSLDVEPLAKRALKTKLLKDHLLSANEHIQRATVSYLSDNAPVTPDLDPSVAKVQSRLLSSKVVAAQVANSVEYLRKFIITPANETDSPSVLAGPDDEESGDDEDDAEAEISSPHRLAKTSATSRVPIPVEKRNSDSEDEEDETRNNALVNGIEDDAGWESGSVADNAVAAAGWESGTVDGSDGEGRENSLDESDADLGQDSDGQHLPVKKPLKAAVAKSAFLPSLAVGFTRGDSDSEFSDSEAKLADGSRKNRRGQRARRAIWEKKFGRNAAHVKKQREIMATKGPFRPAGGSHRPSSHPVDARRQSFGRPGSQPGRAWAPPSNFGPQTRDARPDVYRSSEPRGSAAPSTLPKPKEDKPLHPSWEAKRKQKEQQHAAILPSAGKKIKF